MTTGSARRQGVLRSVAAVVVGIVLIVVFSLGTDRVMQAAGLFPPLGEATYGTIPSLLATVYRSVYAVAGSYLAARLAPNHPMRHALALGVVGFAVSVLGAVVMRGVGPAWYPIALIATSLPCAWVGGKVHGMRAMRLVS